MREHLRLLVLAAASTVGVGSNVFGINTSWTGAAGNAQWSDPGNWSSGVPGAGDRAILELNAGTIDLGGVSRQAGTVSLGGGFNLVNGQLDTPWMQSGAGSTYEVFTSGPALRIGGTIDGRIIDRPAGAGSFEVLLAGAVSGPQPYIGSTWVPVQRERRRRH